MNYDQQINELVETIKADKTIIQPWRNRAVSHVLDGLACVRMGKTSIYPNQVPDELVGPENASNASCICEPGQRHEYCMAMAHVA